MTKASLNAESEGKLRQLYRLLISSRDFKQASLIAHYILAHNLHDQQDYKSQILHEALNCAMIIAYCRPFSGSDQKTRPKIPDLPVHFLRIFDKNEKEIHNFVMEDRNTVLAHSDSSAWNLKPEVWNIKGHKVLVPWQNDTRAPLTRQATEALSGMCQKLIQKVIKTRISLEAELMEFFDTITFSDEELEKIRKADSLGD
jgi:hypothetical protein